MNSWKLKRKTESNYWQKYEAIRTTDGNGTTFLAVCMALHPRNYPERETHKREAHHHSKLKQHKCSPTLV